MGDWSDDEIRTFEHRVEGLRKAGMNEIEAERLAQQTLYRDRSGSGDDRRICLECRAFAKGRCARGLLPLWNVLQRCDAFAMRGAK